MSEVVDVAHDVVTLLTLSAMVDSGDMETFVLQHFTEEITDDPGRASLVIAGLLGFISGVVPTSPEYLEALQKIGLSVYNLEEK